MNTLFDRVTTAYAVVPIVKDRLPVRLLIARLAAAFVEEYAPHIRETPLPWKLRYKLERYNETWKVVLEWLRRDTAASEQSKKEKEKL
jgi:hypothetical protein